MIAWGKETLDQGKKQRKGPRLIRVADWALIVPACLYLTLLPLSSSISDLTVEVLKRRRIPLFLVTLGVQRFLN